MTDSDINVIREILGVVVSFKGHIGNYMVNNYPNPPSFNVHHTENLNTKWIINIFSEANKTFTIQSLADGRNLASINGRSTEMIDGNE